ncbi:MAG: branched-chain amino acid ABC transporter permease [Deltaproteobacteria bacterium]|nr:branched-chain amino acid ABC transporter permease [Deltaproteobacteria bacterium]
MNSYEDLFGLKSIYKKLLGLAAFGLIVLLAPLMMDDLYYLEILFLCHYYVILACSWDLLSGFTGNINFGHAFFIASSGYLGAVLNLNLGWGPWLTLPVGGIIAGLFGLIVGAVTLRLKGPYFAAVTFCFGALLYKWCMISSKFLGGEEGLSGIAPLTDSPLGNYYFSALFMLAVIFLLYLIAKSSFGLILRSIGENEIASEGSGINTTYYKVTAFILSAAIAGVAGAMYAHVQMHVGPEMAHDSLSGLILMMAVVGGMGSIIGPVIGAYLLTLTNESLRFLGEMRLLIYSGAVVLVIFFAPKGLLEIFSQTFRRIIGQER